MTTEDLLAADFDSSVEVNELMIALFFFFLKTFFIFMLFTRMITKIVDECSKDDIGDSVNADDNVKMTLSTQTNVNEIMMAEDDEDEDRAYDIQNIKKSKKDGGRERARNWGRGYKRSCGDSNNCIEEAVCVYLFEKNTQMKLRKGPSTSFSVKA